MGLDQRIVRVKDTDLEKFYVANSDTIIAPYNPDLDHDYIHANATTYRELKDLYYEALYQNNPKSEIYKKHMQELLGSWDHSDIWWGRKENHIHQWVCTATSIHDTNHDYVVINPNILLSDVGVALSNRELAPKIMPTRSGFFFGPTDYDDYYFDSLAALYDVLADDKDLGYFDTHSYFYWSSW